MNLIIFNFYIHLSIIFRKRRSDFMGGVIVHTTVLWGGENYEMGEEDDGRARAVSIAVNRRQRREWVIRIT